MRGIHCCDGAASAVIKPKVGTFSPRGFRLPGAARWQDSRRAECGKSARSVRQGFRAQETLAKTAEPRGRGSTDPKISSLKNKSRARFLCGSDRAQRCPPPTWESSKFIGFQASKEPEATELADQVWHNTTSNPG